MERKNTKTKSVGNGEGSLYYSETENRWIFQYLDLDGKRKTMRQKKKQTVKEFKAEVVKLKNSKNDGTYLGKSTETVITLLQQHIDQKHVDGITSGRSYRRELETLEQIKKTCSNFCNLPIQKVTISHIETAKKEIKKYSNNTIDKIWSDLKIVFTIACSPSRRILIYNLMLDITLKKPISEKVTKKVKPLSHVEHDKLMKILNNEEKEHKYSNIIKMQCISGMRIGEVLARSKDDYDKEDQTFNVHNTLTEDENYNTVLGKHTKTYNKKTQIDEGQRYLPLNNSLFDELKNIIKQECSKKITNMYNLLFWDYEKNYFITTREVDSWLSRIDKKYHICKEKLTSHRLRHYALTYWKELGIPLDVIQYLAGHVEGSDITEGTYIDTSFEFVEKQLEKLG